MPDRAIPSRGAPADAKAVLAISLLLILAALIADQSSVGWTVACIIIPLLTFAMARAPLRYTLFWLTAVNLMLENPTDRPAEGAWHSFFFPLGALMLAHMNQTTGVGWLSFSGSDLIVIILCVIAYLRRSSGAATDARGRVLSPVPLRKLAQLSLLGTVLVELRGMVNDGIFATSLWQVEKVLYIPILFLLFDEGMRDMDDFIALGKVILVAAVYRAMQAYYVMNVVFADGGAPSYGTSHHDSLLFAGASLTLISVLIHRARPHALRTALWIFPVLIAGMVANNRRMVWVQIGLVLLTLYFAMPETAVKIKIRRRVRQMTPLALIYIAIGWQTSGTGIFAPINTIKSVVQPASDVSTMTRDIENYDIAQTIRMHPIIGSGYGVGYVEQISLPPMPHPLERWLPHNSLLGLWFQAGFLGYTAMTLLWTAGVYFGVRAYRAATRPIDRAIALLCFGSVLMYMIQCYGDVGLGSWIAVYTVAPALAAGGKLAVSTGAWPSSFSRARKKPAPTRPESVAADRAA